MDPNQQPEMFSIALSGGNKCTVGFRRIPVTTADWLQICKFLDLLRESLVSDGPVVDPAQLDTSELSIPAPVSSAGRVLRGHFPSEQQLADAAERVNVRQNFVWTRQAMEEARQAELNSRRYSTESDDDSHNS